jgi:hypothetical protein
MLDSLCSGHIAPLTISKAVGRTATGIQPLPTPAAGHSGKAVARLSRPPLMNSVPLVAILVAVGAVFRGF